MYLAGRADVINGVVVAPQAMTLASPLTGGAEIVGDAPCGEWVCTQFSMAQPDDSEGVELVLDSEDGTARIPVRAMPAGRTQASSGPLT